MAGAFWKGSTRLASPSSLIRWSANQSYIYLLGTFVCICFNSITEEPVYHYHLQVWTCRIKCPRITPRNLSNLNGHSPGPVQPKDAFQLAQGSLSTMIGWVMQRRLRVWVKPISQGYSFRTGSWFGTTGQSVGGSSQVTLQLCEDLMLRATNYKAVTVV